MSCSPVIYTPDGRMGIGVNQPQSGLNYPLVAPIGDISLLLADFYLAYEDTAQTFKHPLRIKWLYGVGCSESTKPSWAPTPTHDADILIVDAADQTVFDSTALGSDTGIASFSTWCWGLKKTDPACGDNHAYRAYAWTSNKAVCQLIAFQTWSPDFTNQQIELAGGYYYPTHIAPERAYLDERTVYKIPKRVTSFILREGTTVEQTARTAVDFTAGFNTVIDTSDDLTRGLRNTRQVTFNVEAGGGIGKYEDCTEPVTAIYEINGLRGPNILITANECLWMRVPTKTETGTSLLSPIKINNQVTQVIGSNCPACCTCDDYVSLANYMNSTRDRYAEIGRGANNILLAHSDNIERWTSQRECRLRTPIKAALTPQRCAFMDVVAQYCNLCETCATDAVLKLDFTANSNSAKIVCGYTTVTNKDAKNALYQLNGDWPNFTANLGNVDAGNSASVTFRLEFVNPVPTTVNLTAKGTTSAGKVLAGCAPGLAEAVTVVTRSLYCDGDGKTVPVC